MEKQFNQFDIETKLKNMSPKPLTPEEKTKAWSFIRQRIALEKQKEFSGYSFPLFDIFAKRRAMALAAVVILLGSSLATAAAAAADSAKPGDFLFPLDLASERIRIVLASDTKKDELRLRFAQERVDEARVAVSIFVSANAGVSATSSPPTNGATSTHPTSTSTPSAVNGKISARGIEQARQALEVALEKLRATRAELEAKGNASAVRAIDSLIAELTELAENHIARLDKFRANIKQNDNGLKIAIEASGKELKGKFKFEIKHENNATTTPPDRDDDHEEDLEKRFEEKFERKEEELKERFDRLEERLEEQKERIREREESLRERLRERFDRIFNRDDDDDDDAPIISNLSVNASSTSAVVTWSTNEAADSQVWYSTATPLAIASTTPHTGSTSLVTSHSVALSGLTASTTYYFLVTSADAAGNTATSSESSFVSLYME
ncbi:hypothetical protein A2757_02225 [Candidatus Giovannonibacteria bacterium RIFCSPHIGHO2_01_FULL_48_47]|nr:MAG: hypothetical protein A2757_02225 [Candidatus Giovannonibacteria bacterium RIFCSPHIGHO2_01_FULL_48_47]OGF68505.1 MAG: hypothetical protein A3D61_02655 [Candidatus Giovannonibacteria bacterium RIFCSPHIGHO2_02_FULL_48_15]OGF88467.1 MAG: hypothetical protein A3B26_01930 [Candidatus Giovannonibacteria bacterium RIFCSPLOWO2_01_FULL_48_47]OGF94649.1 MAG: hypothetical protein A2433_02925 [Candidatus Giovannonibacteria bacterium RIFOXYC1_FULL_48_8]OGF96503.1 MAG: hypothetical protein A2613_03050